MKNDSDIITTPDPLFAPGDEVMHNGTRLTVRDFSWSALKKAWTYSLFVGSDRRSMGGDEFIPRFAEVFESEISLRDSRK